DSLLAVLSLAHANASLVPSLTADPDTLDSLRVFVSADPNVMKAAARFAGTGQTEIDEMYRKLEELSDLWDRDIPEAAANAVAAIGAEELISAVTARAIEVADLSGQTSMAMVADSVNAALGASDRALADEVIGGFTERVVEMLTENQTFPLLDASSSELVTALLNENRLLPSEASIRRGVEVSATAGLMGFLPNF